MYNTDKTSFSGNTDWVNAENNKLVFEGDVLYGPKDTWTVIEFDTPFTYNGGNVIVCINDSAPYAPATMNYYSMETSEPRSIYAYRDNIVFDATNIDVASHYTAPAKYVAQTQFTFAGGSSDEEDNLTPAPKNVVASNNEIFDGFVPSISWDAIEDNENLYGYNVYFTNGTIIGGEEYVTKVNNNIISPETTSYDLSTLRYNMDHGYVITVRAVYEIEGQYIESKDSKSVTIKVSGNGTMSGIVYDYDGTTPLSGAAVSVSGKDEFGTDVVSD